MSAIAKGAVLVLAGAGTFAGFKYAETQIPNESQIAAARLDVAAAEAQYFYFADGDDCERTVLVTIDAQQTGFSRELGADAIKGVLSASCGSDELADELAEKIDKLNDARRNAWNIDARGNGGNWFKFWGGFLGGTGTLMLIGAGAAVALDESYHW